VDCRGDFVIEPVFERLCPFSEGFAAFYANGRFGFIDSSGNIAIGARFLAASAQAPCFACGLCPAREETLVGYVDTCGQWAIPPQFQYGGQFFREHAVVLAAESLPGYCLIDKRGMTITEFQAYEVDLNPGDLDLIHCTFQVESELMDGFVNWHGNTVISPARRFISAFSDGFAQYSEEQFGPYGFLDSKGRPAIPLRFWNRPSRFVEGLAPAAISKGRVGFIGKNGEFLVPPLFDAAASFSEGLARIATRGMVGYVDKLGNQVIPAAYSQAEDFRDGFAVAEHSGKFCLLDRRGHRIYQEV